MKKLSSFLFLWIVLLITKATTAQELYSAAYGDKTKPAIIFLHGGPGYNSFSFESSTAERLATEGYYVIVFDQRGCGRSIDIPNSKYNFEEAVDDIEGLYEKYNIRKATLIGHSWGGALGVAYAEKYPQKVGELLLVAAPMDYPETFKAILKNSRAAYTAKGKDDQLKYLDMLEDMDTASLPYANYCFMHAMASGLYTAKEPATNVTDIYKKMMSSEDAALLRNMTQEPVKGFYDTERYTMLQFYGRLKKLKKKVPIYGVFGSDDGLFNETQIDNIRNAIGADRVTVVKNASHSVFIDQQEEFIHLVKKGTAK